MTALLGRQTTHCPVSFISECAVLHHCGKKTMKTMTEETKKTKNKKQKTVHIKPLNLLTSAL